MRTTALVVALAAAASLVSSCGSSSTTPTTKAPEKKSEAEKPVAVTGRTAFFKMYPSARQWAADAKGIQLSSVQVKEVPGEPGQAAMWQATFVSESKAKTKSFVWSAVDAPPSIRQGVWATGREEAFLGGRVGQALPFFVQGIKTDTDEAYKTAISKEDKFLKTNPTDSVNFLLEYTQRTNALAWRVLWGETAGTAKYSVFVDATTGAFISKVR